ncbi:MAG: Mth938-like domain-containing protein [Bosea sp. (in: a-proteobacteria)]
MAKLERKFEGFVPGRWPIDAYSQGGFRFAEMSHRGAILALPAGVSILQVASADQVSAENLCTVLAEDSGVDFLIIGTGALPVSISQPVREALRERRISLEAMTTPAAIRTYHVLVGEGRRVAAALIPVE